MCVACGRVLESGDVEKDASKSVKDGGKGKDSEHAHFHPIN